MSEEKKTPSPAPEENESSKKPEKGEQQRHSERSVMRYLSVLFVAAFALLLLTFAMESRQHQQEIDASQAQIDTLQESSNSAAKRLDKLVEENERLTEELEKAKKNMQTSVQDWQSEKSTLITQVEAKDKALSAMDWFWQVNEAYAKQRWSLCRSLIQDMEELGLVEYLPKESQTDNQRFSPYDRYQEIYDRVF